MPDAFLISNSAEDLADLLERHVVGGGQPPRGRHAHPTSITAGVTVINLHFAVWPAGS